MNIRRLARYLAGTMALLLAPAAQAMVIIDFGSSLVAPSTPIGERRTEDGFNIDYFWYDDVGSPAWTPVASGGHDHNFLTANGTVGENQHFNSLDQLQGFRLSRIDGNAFSLISMDVDLGFGAIIDGVGGVRGVLLADESFAPAGHVLSQFALSPQGVVSGFATVLPAGFSNVSELWISSTASYDFDNIHLGAPVPEPASVVLLGLGLAGLGVRRRRGN